MSDNKVRPIEVRLKEYAEATRALNPQMIAVAEAAEAKFGKAANTEPLRDAARLYELIANDLDKILAGEELTPFRVEGVL
jgi:hypothetical protein